MDVCSASTTRTQSIFPVFPSHVVRVLMRYIYFHTLNIYRRPLSVDRSIFITQLNLMAAWYKVTPLRDLTRKLFVNVCDSPENFEVLIAALRQTYNPRNDYGAEGSEEWVAGSVRVCLQLRAEGLVGRLDGWMGGWMNGLPLSARRWNLRR